MIAAFLKKVDGGFDYFAVIVSLFLAFAISWTLLKLCRAPQRGFLELGNRGSGSIYFRCEREKQPLGYWLLFAFYCLTIPLYIYFIYAVCFGLFRRTA